VSFYGIPEHKDDRWNWLCRIFWTKDWFKSVQLDGRNSELLTAKWAKAEFA